MTSDEQSPATGATAADSQSTSSEPKGSLAATPAPAYSIYPNGTCPNCGGPLLGDGYRTVLHCEQAGDIDEIEPDARPVFCSPDNQAETHRP